MRFKTHIQSSWIILFGLFMVVVLVGFLTGNLNTQQALDEKRTQEKQALIETAQEYYTKYLTEQNKFTETFSTITIGVLAGKDLQSSTKNFNEWLKTSETEDVYNQMLVDGNTRSYKTVYPLTYAQLRNAKVTVSKTKIDSFFPEGTVVSSPNNLGSDTVVFFSLGDSKCELLLTERTYNCE